MIITFLLNIPSLAYPQPQKYFDAQSLSAIQKGELLLRQSLNDQALRLYQSLIDERKGGEYAFRGMVRAYKSMDNLKDAEVWIKNFMSKNLDSSSGMYSLGYVYYLKNDMKKAEAYFKKALKLDSNNTLALNNFGAVLSNQNLHTQAAEKVQKAIRINPKEPMFYKNLETIYKNMGNPELIIADYYLYLKQGSLDLIRGYGIAVGRHLRQNGFKLYNDGRLIDAISKFMEIETIFKRINHQFGLVPIYFSLGLLHEEKGDLEKSKIYFNKVLKLNPLHIQAKERLNLLR